MKSTHMAAVVAVALGTVVSGAAWSADEATPSRAEVRKDYIDARKAGTLPKTSEVGVPLPKGTQTSRPEVREEFREARKEGALPTTSEVGTPAPKGSEKSRAAVRSDTRRAVKEGKIPRPVGG